MGLFGPAQNGRGSKRVPHPKICHKYPKMMKLGTVYLKKMLPYLTLPTLEHTLPKEDPKSI